MTSSTPASDHLIIAGTGRTGTTFLVRYLTELGLDTHISRHGEEHFDPVSQAGFEDMPLIAAAESLPYVIKAPWIGEYIDDILAHPDIKINAAILPVRNLIEAASSRTILELRALHQNAPWMARLGTTFENWATTPGGTIFSLNPLDQARILALSFHRLVERLVAAGIPILPIAFPRFIDDADYLFERLRSVLPATATLEQARTAHQRTAKREKVRTGDELRSHAQFPLASAPLSYPSHDQLDRIALGREIARLHEECARLEAQYQEVRAELKAMKAASKPEHTPVTPTPALTELAVRAFCRRAGQDPNELIHNTSGAPFPRWQMLMRPIEEALFVAGTEGIRNRSVDSA
jgi:hypothetical protein